jgi:hypothetical protein
MASSDAAMKKRPSIPHHRKPSCGFLAILLLATTAVLQCHAGAAADWRDKMAPIIPQGYLCRHTATPIVVDGNLDE